MVFYLAVSIIFTIYTIDLLVLVIVAAIAKAREHGHPTELDRRFDKNADAAEDASLKQYPKVLIQIPMYNEETFCELIVERCCKVKWPRERLLIQVLDDSTKESVRTKVDGAVAVACEQGHGVEVLRRDNRQGFKAGALVEGLQRAELLGYEYVAIMDADFDPPEDFLYQTIAPLEANSKLGFIQACWVFVNVNTFLTWAQSVNLNFHHEVEQRARSYAGWFFNFCGTAGVWRVEAINDAGGWESDTVVEDMDLSLRAYLKGWDGLYLHHVKVPNELPPTLAAYKTQQFRWLSGPMQILVKCFGRIILSRNVSFGRKMSCYWFFFRYILFAIISIVVLAIPPIILWVEHWHWGWETIFFICSINCALAVYLYVTPLSILYLLFSVAIGYFKTWAMLAGLFGSKKSKSWKVTKKFGSASKGRRVYHKPYFLELMLFLYYAALAFFGLWYRNWFMGGYCVVMAVCFITLSLGDYIM